MFLVWSLWNLTCASVASAWFQSNAIILMTKYACSFLCASHCVVDAQDIYSRGIDIIIRGYSYLSIRKILSGSFFHASALGWMQMLFTQILLEKMPPVQWSAVIPWSNITWYCIHHCSQRQNRNQSLNLQNISHTSNYWATYGMYFVRILWKIHCLIMESHCIYMVWQ